MPDLDKLERLNQLRQSGALTEEEFQTQKAKILADEKDGARGTGSNQWLLIGIAAAVVTVLIATILLVRSTSSDIGNATLAKPGSSYSLDGNDTEVALSNEITPTPIPTPTAVNQFAWASNEERIDNNPAYLEQKLGPAVEKDEYSMRFDVGGCQVRYSLARGSVSSIDIPVTAKCSPLVRGRTITPATTFASLRSQGGLMTASCLGNCGNAADPTIDWLVPGTHASNLIEVDYEASQKGPILDAQNLWERAIRRTHGLAEDDDSQDVDIFNCPSNPPQEVVRSMNPSHIAWVHIGYELNRQCKSSD